MGRDALPHLSTPGTYDALCETSPSGDWERPCEDPADGCPGAWYRTEFIDSFRRYRRGDLGNPLVNADTPAHVIDALLFFEHQQGLARMAYHEAIKRS